jgi:quinol monooxygenase YgiN
MNKYLLQGKLIAKDGQRQALAEILIKASKLLATAKGCQLYAVALEEKDANSVYITEFWDSKEDHDNSLKVEGVRELIMTAMPILEGQPQKGQELEILN